MKRKLRTNGYVLAGALLLACGNGLDTSTGVGSSASATSQAATGGNGGHGGSASVATGGSGGAAGAGGSMDIVEQCKSVACAEVPGCRACEELCEDMCTSGGCGPDCGVDYMIECLAGQSCEEIASMQGLVLDPEIYACMVVENITCGFAGGSAEHCWHCTFDACAAPLAQCDADAACHDWLACIESQNCPEFFPNNPDCYRHCDSSYPEAAALYGAVYACSCANCSACGVHQDPCAVTP